MLKHIGLAKAKDLQAALDSYSKSALELVSLREKYNSLRQEARAASQQRDQYQLEVRAARTELARIRDELKSLREKHNGLRLEALVAAQKYERNQTEIGRLRQEIFALRGKAKTDRNQLSTERLESARKINELKTQIASRSASQNFFERSVRGAPFIECAVEYVREQLVQQNRVTARCFAHALVDDPENRRTGVLCSAILAYADGFPVLAAKHFSEVSHHDGMRYAPVEYIHITYDKNPEEGLSLLATTASDADPKLLFELAKLAVNIGRLDQAWQIVSAEPTEQFLAQLNTLATHYTYLRDGLSRWALSRSEAPLPKQDATIHFGLIDYRTLDYDRASSNIGDYVQTLALFSNVLRFSNIEFSGENGLGSLAAELKPRIHPLKAIHGQPAKVSLTTVSRDFSSGAAYPKPTWMVAYGWFMHPNFKAFDFPFAENIRPIFISFHVNNRACLTPVALDYLRRYQPIGCRDWTTVYLLREYGIKAFFSGCITTTIGKLYPQLVKEPQASKKVALVDYTSPKGDVLDGEMIAFEHADIDVRTHDFVENMKEADRLLSSYRDFDAIATSRLHCYLPCTALGLDVIFKPASMSDIRFEGLVELDPHGFKSMCEGIEGKLEKILGRIFSGAGEEAVYAYWQEICADSVDEAEQYCKRYPPLSAPGFDIKAAAAKLLAGSWTDMGATTGLSGSKIEVALAADQNLRDELPAVLESLLSHTSRPVQFHIMTRGLDRQYWEAIRRSFAQASFSFYDFDIVNYGEQLKMLSHTTVSTMDRLLLPELLSGLDKVIYLDIDIMVLDDLGKLWDLDITSHKLAGKLSNHAAWKYGYNLVYQAAQSLPHHSAWELRRRMHAEGPLAFNAFNAGVLIMNLARMREDKFSENFIPLIERYKMNDQDVLNVYARTDRLELGVEWNAVPGQDNLDGAKIVHFAGAVKPWDERYVPMKGVFQSFKAGALKRQGRRQQFLTATNPGRNLAIIQQTHDALSRQGIEPKKILSFGCSEGWECLDIQKVFPSARVFGCDVNPSALAAAEQRVGEDICIFYSSPATLQQHGPFDLVFAFNVLCRYPDTAGLDDISGVYPFSEFDDLLREIDAHIVTPGALVVYNSPYFMEDAAISAHYSPLPLPHPENGWIEKCSRDGTRITDVRISCAGRIFARDEFRQFLRNADKDERLRYENERMAEMLIRPGFSTLHSCQTILWMKN